MKKILLLAAALLFVSPAFAQQGSVVQPPCGGAACSVTSLSVSGTGTISPSQTGGIVGTNTNNSANAGSVGEYVEAIVASGSAVSLTNNTAANITSISLTAGDWDVSATIRFTGAAGTLVTYGVAAVNTNSAAIPTGGQTSRSDLVLNNFAVYATGDFNIPVGPFRFSLAATTTIYLVAQQGFTVDTSAAYGQIRARRVR